MDLIRKGSEFQAEVLTNLDYDRLWFNTLIRPSHESLIVYFVCRSFSLLQVQGCQTVSESRLFVAERSIAVCATCFDIGYKVSDICDDEGDAAHCSCYLFHCRSRSVCV